MPHRALWSRNRGDTESIRGTVRLPGAPGVRVPAARDLTGQQVIATVRRRVDNAIVQQSMVEVLDGPGGLWEMQMSPDLADSVGLHSVVLTPAVGGWSWPDPLSVAWLQVLEAAGASAGTSVVLPAGSTWTNRGAARLMAGTFDPEVLDLALLAVSTPLALVRLWNTDADLVGELAVAGYSRRALGIPIVIEADSVNEGRLDFGDVVFSGLVSSVPLRAVAAVDRVTGDVLWVSELETPATLDGSPVQVVFAVAGVAAVPALRAEAAAPLGSSVVVSGWLTVGTSAVLALGVSTAVDGARGVAAGAALSGSGVVSVSAVVDVAGVAVLPSSASVTADGAVTGVEAEASLSATAGLLASAEVVPAVLASASSWYDASDIFTTDQQTLPNRVGAGVATFGSTSGSDFNDPARFPHDGENYVWFPSSGLNNLTGTATATPTTSLVMVMDFDPEPAAGWNQALGWLMSFDSGPGGALFAFSAGSPGLWATGATLVSSGHPPSGRLQWRLTRDLVANTVQMAWRDDGVVDPVASGWNVSASTSNSTPFTGTNVPAIGDIAGYRPCPGKLYHASHWVDGVMVRSTGTIGASQTIVGDYGVNRSTSGLTTAVVTRPVMLFDDVDDYLQLPVSDIPAVTHTTGGFTVLVAHRYWNQTGRPAVWGSGPISARGLALYHLGGSLFATARSATQSLTNSMPIPLPGAFACKGLVADNGSYRPYASGLPEDAFADMTSLTNLDISTVAGPRINSAHAQGMSAPFGGEYFAVVQWPRALTQQELDDASAFLLGTY